MYSPFQTASTSRADKLKICAKKYTKLLDGIFAGNFANVSWHVTRIRKAGKPSGKPSRERTKSFTPGLQFAHGSIDFPLPLLRASLMKFRAILIYKLKMEDCGKEKKREIQREGAKTMRT